MSIDAAIDALERKDFTVHLASGLSDYSLEILADEDEIDSIIRIIESTGHSVGQVDFEEPAYVFVEVR